MGPRQPGTPYRQTPLLLRGCTSISLGEFYLSTSQSPCRFSRSFLRKSTRAERHSTEKAPGVTKSLRTSAGHAEALGEDTIRSGDSAGYAAAQLRGARGLLWRIPTRVSSQRSNMATRIRDGPDQSFPRGHAWITCGSRHQSDKGGTLPDLYKEGLVVPDWDSHIVVDSDSAL